jgi:CMP-N-acetylneuraminic acid synthetase
MKLCALIPLRGGSKSIPDKNIKPIAGKPLCSWVIYSALNCEAFDAIYISTDSARIANVATSESPRVRIVDRPRELATDHATTESVMLHFAKSFEFDALVTIQATSPLLTTQNLDEAIASFKTNKFDSMLSATRTKRFFWSESGHPINYEPKARPRRQDFLGTLMENGAFYITSRDLLIREKCRLGGKIGIYEMSEDSAIELDEPADWEAVEKILLTRKTL